MLIHRSKDLRRVWISKSYRSLQVRNVVTLEDVDDNPSKGYLLGIGGTKIGRSNPQQYAKIVETALQNGVQTFESVNGGEESLAQAYTLATMQMGGHVGCPKEKDVTITARFGYRTEEDKDNMKSYKNDVCLENDSNKGPSSSASDQVFHNIGSEYVYDCIEKSPLVKLKKGEWGQNGETKDINFIFMAHNPEAQGSQLFGPGAGQPPIEDVRALVRERLYDAFKGLEEACSNGTISSYGVCSNGLSLPSSHPLYLDWKDVISAAMDASHAIHGKATVPKLSTLQLPSNLLETNGLNVAKEIKLSLDKENCPNIYTSRPLTCYSDQGTGTGFPFKLLDYEIALGMTPTDKSMKEWTHKIKGDTPPQYTPALNLALQHFDAEDILNKEGSLTVEEKETLDGCRLLQSMLHDLDRSLENMRSFDAYEDELYSKVIPLIHDTFEQLDEESASVLQAFFVAHGSAVRHAVARTTRQLLRKGGDGVPAYDISPHVLLQEFALKYLLDNKYVSKVIVGCAQPHHVIGAVNATKSVDR